jgi:putative DNA primase/helicase
MAAKTSRPKGKPAADKITEQLEDLLEKVKENKASWQKDYTPAQLSIPYNGATGKEYKARTGLILLQASAEKGYDDPRWATFSQAREKEWQVRKGEKGTMCYEWIPQIKDEVSGKYRDLKRDGLDKDKTPERFRPVTFHLFNAAQIDNIPKLERPAVPQQEVDDRASQLHFYLDTIARGLEIPVKEGNFSPPHYAYALDEKGKTRDEYIALPFTSSFNSLASAGITKGHETRHALQHEERLNHHPISVSDEGERVKNNRS